MYISGKLPGNFRETSKTFPGNVREIYWKLPGHFREIARTFPGKSLYKTYNKSLYKTLIKNLYKTCKLLYENLDTTYVKYILACTKPIRTSIKLINTYKQLRKHLLYTTYKHLYNTYIKPTRTYIKQKPIYNL